MKLIDITGMRSGRLIVIGRGEPRKGGGSNWRCHCDCGNAFVGIGSSIRRGITRSCGCLAHEWAVAMGSNPEFIAKRAKKMTRHGQKQRRGMTAEYRTWLSIKRRCQAPKSKDYANWGGRGISVCERWNDSFEAFFADMGVRPSDRHSIDRLDSDGNYEPGNCRWATPAQQSENKRTNRSVTVGGVEFETLARACRNFGVGVTTASERIRAGIDVATAVSYKGRLPSRRTRESYLPRANR